MTKSNLYNPKTVIWTSILRIALTIAVILFALLRPGMLSAGDDNNYVGANAGFAILSGDGRSHCGDDWQLHIPV
jgi:hypothetical protein